MTHLRILTDDDWPLWRNLRLQALAEAPHAFSSKLADWQGDGDTEARWRARLAGAPLNLVAEIDHVPAGMASAAAPDTQGTVELISLWVAPFARGRGVGDLLISTVVTWAKQRQLASVWLLVFDNNESALSLYRRHNFQDRGVIAPTSPDMQPERQMVCDL